MQLTASPFDSTTGTLLPVYRDAYLRGDLSRPSTQAVEAYLKANRQLGDETLLRFYDMHHQGESVKPIGWVGRQLESIRTEPQRFRRRAASLVAGAALVAGASMAAVNLPEVNLPEVNLPTEVPTVSERLTASLPSAEAAAASSLRMVTVRGRILDENGHPLVGATVLNKTTGWGAGTDANGNYTLVLPANQAQQLQYAYAGYAEDDIALQGRYTQNVTLLPTKLLTAKAPKKHRRWWLF
ncbi:hypothetical protein CDA63_18345 [Hymenobacter amundsenii]|uniref:Uncharacterized protein n=1 Tax=Hymenobacter amundsenii TaxID=2006685 RepID=A0A246FGK9_9BACT|nr:carboxypeptidase-like regulatory domain-containing protein [Hymenobacter amundsenii]OWP61652.1 hypothetical protein CDA63_18345 [Hymenobacter amundsenii]